MGPILLLAIIPLALLFYVFSVNSRKHYECPECGERIMVEHMEASRCSSCGAPLRRED